MSFEAELKVAADAARGAGQIARAHFGRIERMTKTHATTNNEPVTEADRAAQRLVVTMLRENFPDDGIVGEETDAGDGITFDVNDPAGRNWVIDPIDGTNNFIAGHGAFAVCIGLLERGMPVVGVVYDVTRDCLYAASSGGGCFVDGERTTALDTPLSDSSLLMLTSNLVGAGGKLPAFVPRWLGQTNWKVRILGSAALEAAQVAAGVAHGAITINGKLWDVAAAAALVLEAGGRLTTPEGAPLFPFDLTDYRGRKVPFLAAAPNAQQQLLAEVASEG